MLRVVTAFTIAVILGSELIAQTKETKSGTVRMSTVDGSRIVGPLRKDRKKHLTGFNFTFERKTARHHRAVLGALPCPQNRRSSSPRVVPTVALSVLDAGRPERTKMTMVYRCGDW
jgi:hypothetical protein